MPRGHKRQKAKKFEYFEDHGTYWHCVHSDKSYAWIVEFDKGRKNCGGPVKKVPKSFLESRELLILAM